MTTLTFRKAERRKAKLRLGLSGASGSGKTYSALLIAFGLGQRVAVIDTENGSADLYDKLGDYDVLQIQAPYSPEKFTAAIHAAEQAGYGTVIIDSLSHAWSGEGGVLEIKDNIGSSFQAWKTVTPRHNALVEAILQSPCHIIATMRAKAEYIVAENDKGKATPTKVGLAPIQREGMEYEFTVFLDLSAQHVATASKDRTGLIDGNPVKNPGKKLGQTLLAWLEGVADAPQVETPREITPWDKAQKRLRAIMGSAAKSLDLPASTMAAIVKEYAGKTFQGRQSTKDLSADELHQIADTIDADPLAFVTIAPHDPDQEFIAGNAAEVEG